MEATINELMEVLLDHPRLISVWIVKAQEATLKEQAIQRSSNLIEKNVYREVHAETLPDGKKAFPNESLREAEVYRRMNSEEHATVRDALRDAHMEKHVALARVEQYKLEHRGVIAAVNLLGTKTGEER